MFSEYVGLTQDVASFIEGKRLSPLETKSAILKRILITTEMVPEDAYKSVDREFDFGQGVRIARSRRRFRTWWSLRCSRSNVIRMLTA